MSDDADADMTDDDFLLKASVTNSSDAEFARGVIRDKHEVFVDEPEWLPHGAGQDAHPSPMDYMNFALTACQVSVLSQCLEKSRVEEFEIDAQGKIDDVIREDVPDEMPENTRTRVNHVTVEIEVEVPEEYENRARRCLEVYDQGCIVGQSYKAGVPYDPETKVTVTTD